MMSCAARAQFSASIAADSDYRFRGVSLSGSKPAVRISANMDAASGWYAGASATQATLSQGERYAQLLGYAGYTTPMTHSHSFEFGASYSVFLGNRQYDYAEAYAGILAQRWSLRLNYSPDYFGRHVQTVYLDGSTHWPLSETARLFAHAGLLVPLAGGGDVDPLANRTRVDIRAGAGQMLRDVDVQLAWTLASRGGPFPAIYGGRRTGWSLSASYSF
jgi:uncharacterized protein (TIGR02001 family)